MRRERKEGLTEGIIKDSRGAGGGVRSPTPCQYLLLLQRRVRNPNPRLARNYKGVGAGCSPSTSESAGVWTGRLDWTGIEVQEAGRDEERVARCTSCVESRGGL